MEIGEQKAVFQMFSVFQFEITHAIGMFRLKLRQLFTTHTLKWLTFNVGCEVRCENTKYWKIELIQTVWIHSICD